MGLGQGFVLYYNTNLICSSEIILLKEDMIRCQDVKVINASTVKVMF